MHLILHQGLLRQQPIRIYQLRKMLGFDYLLKIKISFFSQFTLGDSTKRTKTKIFHFHSFFTAYTIIKIQNLINGKVKILPCFEIKDPTKVSF